MKLNKSLFLTAYFFMSALFAGAQGNISKLPGDTTLPSSKETLDLLASFDKGDYKYKVEDYFARPKARNFQISPDGKFISYKEKDDHKKNHVYIKEIKTGKVERIIEEGKDLIANYFWIDSTTVGYTQDIGGDENYHLFVTSILTKENKDLSPYEGVKVISAFPIKDSPFVILLMNKNNKQIFEPFKINFKTGEFTQIHENKDPKNPIQGYTFDKLGNIRGYQVLENGVTIKQYYKDLDTGEFNLLVSTSWKDHFSIVEFNFNSKNKNEAYVMTNLDSDKSRLVLYDLKENKILKEVYSNPSYGVSSVSFANKRRNYELDYITYEGERNVIVPISKFFTPIYNELISKFNGSDVSVISSDNAEKTLLILVGSDKHYGSYYEYDVASKQIKLLYELMPQLKSEDMAEMRPIQFKSRDGLTIHGYITLPKEALNGKKIPLIVNPHGGPQGIRDSWGFNPEAQLFASRGYATLQVNFRISGGYGKHFQQIGYKQIGRKVMDDVEDGVKYVIEQGWVDDKKIAIYGGSHGGYATLMGLIKTPDLYACGVDYVGVSSIFTFFDSFPEYWKPLKNIAKEIWYDLDNPEENKIAKEVSPIYQIGKIKKPLFVVQGANDPRVKIAESDQIVKALRAKGFDVPYMVKYDEGHGFGKEQNSIELYKSMMGFFAKNFATK